MAAYRTYIPEQINSTLVQLNGLRYFNKRVPLFCQNRWSSVRNILYRLKPDFKCQALFLLPPWNRSCCWNTSRKFSIISSPVDSDVTALPFLVLLPVMDLSGDKRGCSCRSCRPGMMLECFSKAREESSTHPHISLFLAAIKSTRKI